MKRTSVSIMLGLLALVLNAGREAMAQQFELTWYTIDGGGVRSAAAAVSSWAGLSGSRMPPPRFSPVALSSSAADSGPRRPQLHAWAI